jgi:hypothetical protein
MAVGTNAQSTATVPPATAIQPAPAADTSRLRQVSSLVDQMMGKTGPTSAPSAAPARTTHVATSPSPQINPIPALAIAPPIDGTRAAAQQHADSLWQQVAGSNVTNSNAIAATPSSIANSALAQGRVPNAAADATAAATREIQSTAAGLWRPLTQQQGESTALAVGSASSSPNVPTPSENSPGAGTAGIAESAVGSFLLQPFYATNGNPPRAAGGGPYPTAVASVAERDLSDIVRNSSLVTQLAPASQKAVRRLPSIEQTAKSGSTKLVTYLQENAPQPNDLDINAQGQLELVPEPDATDQSESDEDGEGEGEGDSLAEAERLGEEPEDNTLEFLRAETVLLKPGDSQCDVGLNYLLTETEFPILLADDMGAIVGVDEVNFRIRELTLPIEYRVGLLPRVQGFIGAPVGWSNTQLALDSFEAFQNDGGFGDINFGLTMQFAEATANKPYVIGTLNVTAPTGGDPFTSAVGLAPTAPSLGQGFWSINGSLLCIKPYDPIVFFYGIGTERFFPHEYVGLDIEPGAQYTYNFGVGFAVNERVTLSTRFNGAYTEELEVNGERRFGTNSEPMTIRFSATISQPCDRLVEPFVEFGITDDAISSFIGVTWTFSHIHKEPKNGEQKNEAQQAKTPTESSQE